MIFRLFRPTPSDPIIAMLYGTIVAQARAPVFYRQYRVPDTVNGRLEMIMLHAVLLLWRLEQGAEPLPALGQAVFDRFCADMDESLREMGVGDLAVPRKMRQVGEAFYGRQAAYRTALAADGAELGAALERNVFAGALEPAGAAWLAAYARAAASQLAAQDGFERGEVAFPDPAQVPSPPQPAATAVAP
jgi:cytochrome b pre-mRNA-processing protein 3